MLRQLCSRGLQSLAALQGRCTASGLAATTLRAASSLTELSRPGSEAAASQVQAWSSANRSLLATPSLGLGLEAHKFHVTRDPDTILGLFASQSRGHAAAAAAAAAVKKTAPVTKKKKIAPASAAGSKPKPKPKAKAAAATKGRVRAKPVKAKARTKSTAASGAAARRPGRPRDEIKAAGRKAAKDAAAKARLRVRAAAQRARARKALALAKQRERAKAAAARRREREAAQKQKLREKLAAVKAAAKIKEAARIKRAPTAWTLYLQEHSRAVREGLPVGAANGAQRQVIAFKVLAERFKKLSDAERAPYLRRAAELKVQNDAARAKAKADRAAKTPVSPYILYFKAMYASTRQAHPELDAKQVAAKMGELWRALPPEQQQRYRDAADADRKAKGLRPAAAPKASKQA